MSTRVPGTRRRARPGGSTGAVAISALIAAGALLLGLGGCAVSIRDRDPVSAKVEEVLDSGRGHFDLATPPSREEAGMPAGRDTVTYEPADKEPLHVRVSLPEGEELALDARLVGFDSLGSPDPATGPPTTLDIHHYPASLAAGRDHLLAAARQFGVDPEAIDEWYEKATSPRPVAAPPTVRTRWMSTAVGYLHLQVQGRYSPPVDTPESDQTVVHYSLTWGADPTSRPS